MLKYGVDDVVEFVDVGVMLLFIVFWISVVYRLFVVIIMFDVDG